MKTKKMTSIFITLLIMAITTTTCFAGHGENVLRPGEYLTPGQFLKSHNGQFILRMQTDGNLVLYSQGTIPIWSTGTSGSKVEKLIMQTDGNLVMYGDHANAIWHTRTQGNPGAYLKASSDGTVQIRYNGKAIRIY
ncbi:hypothetical protein [Wukongibacter sp. M2B1]|uniref:hypothetical protein n=1 Tax=Wukongibacter sp. M2B1 TaxID=3088895 RepID=UPI003D79B81E